MGNWMLEKGSKCHNHLLIANKLHYIILAGFSKRSPGLNSSELFIVKVAPQGF